MSVYIFCTFRVSIRWSRKMVVLVCFHADLGMESVGHNWGNCRQLRLVALSAFQVNSKQLLEDFAPRVMQHELMFVFCFRLEGEAYTHFKSMLISLSLHLILLMFELLVCDKLESGRHMWILVFIPLIFISIVSIAVCIWAVKHDRSFEVS